MERAHAAALARAGADPEIWRYLPYGPCETAERMERLISALLERQASGSDLAFTVVDAASGAVVGMTRFLEIDREHRRAEIGGTWYERSMQRTPCNTECKRLLLTYAFEAEVANRVQFKTDARNERSQRAIERIGGVREGILRDHMVMPDGFRRSSVVYSIVAGEWPAVRDRLDALRARPRTRGSTAPA
jgi:RimJ/RimL family protein N-acetyltransferase